MHSYESLQDSTSMLKKCYAISNEFRTEWCQSIHTYDSHFFTYKISRRDVTWNLACVWLQQKWYGSEVDTLFFSAEPVNFTRISIFLRFCSHLASDGFSMFLFSIEIEEIEEYKK